MYLAGAKPPMPILKESSLLAERLHILLPYPFFYAKSTIPPVLLSSYPSLPAIIFYTT
jgi:hypothetical protein